jgi:hypothetical protein
VDDNMNNIEFIVYTGYYLKDEDDVNTHNDYTWNLYVKGLETCGELSDDEIYDGVLFIEGKPHAQVDFDRYIRL